MDEEKKEETEGEKTKGDAPKESVQGKDNPTDGNTPEKESKPSMIDGAVLAAEELKKQNDRKEALLDREEKLAAHKALGGTTEAGQAPVKKEETPREYTEKVMSGELNG